MHTDDLAGLVLAGGAGRRLGTPKATAVLGGSTLAERAVAALRPRCSRVVVASREAVPLPALDADVDVVLDDGGARSAMTGLLTGLGALSEPRVLVLACDLWVTAGLLERLVTAPGASAMATDDDGPQPLCARYDREAALTACRTIVESGDLRVRQLADLLGPALVPVEPGELININTPADLARAAQILS